MIEVLRRRQFGGFPDPVLIDGVWYHLDKTAQKATVAITPSGKTLYSGDIVLPTSVAFRGKMYSVKNIEAEAFKNCTGVTSMSIPNSIVNNGIGTGAFSGCSNMIEVTIDNHTIVSKTYTTGSNLQHIFGTQVTDYTIGDNVTAIGAYAFYGCTNMTSVVIGANVKTIGNYVFQNSGLTSVEVPENVTTVSSMAFYNCRSLVSVILHGRTGSGSDAKGLEAISSMVFSECRQLSSITIPYGIKTISNNAFAGCRSLSSVSIPTTVTGIGTSAFEGCSSLSSAIDFSANTITSIGSKVFKNCGGIPSVTFPTNITPTTLPAEIFYNCTSLSSFTIPDNITVIGNSAFLGCSSITSVTIGNSVTSIGNMVFSACRRLETVNLPISVTTLGVSVFNASGIKNFDFSDIPNITVIPSGTFYSSSIISVSIPSTVTEISDNAFLYAGSLSTVNCYCTTPPILGTTVFNSQNSAVLHIPSGSLSTYQNSEWATYFGTIVDDL